MLEKVIMAWEQMRRHPARLDKIVHQADTMFDRHSSRVPQAHNVLCWGGEKTPQAFGRHQKHSFSIRSTFMLGAHARQPEPQTGYDTPQHSFTRFERNGRAPMPSPVVLFFAVVNEIDTATLFYLNGTI